MEPPLGWESLTDRFQTAAAPLAGIGRRKYDENSLPGGVMVTQGILVPSFKVRILAG